MSNDRSSTAANKGIRFMEKAGFVVHCILGIAIHDLFIYSMFSKGLEFWGPQWPIYCTLQALVPILSAVVIHCCSPSTCTKLLCRPYFSTAAIWALVYIIVGNYWIDDERKSAIILEGSIGLFSSLYHWCAVEYLCFKGTTNTTSGAKKAAEDDSLEELA